MSIEHLSYSQYSSYVKCPRSWYLSKVRMAEEKQTWYIPIGTAFHTMIEARLKGEPELSAEEIFYPLVEKQMEIEPDTSTWLSGGSKENPVVEERALQLLKDCYDKALTGLGDFEVWEVEHEATGSLPGCPVPIKAFVDVIGKHKKHGPVILDWKTGKNKPKDNFQLETYGSLLAVGNLYVDIQFKGLWGMVNPLASSPRPIDLSSVSPADVGQKYGAVYQKMVDRLYQSKHGYDCRFCFHQDNCLDNMTLATKRALYFDRSAVDGFPF